MATLADQVVKLQGLDTTLAAFVQTAIADLQNEPSSPGLDKVIGDFQAMSDALKTALPAGGGGVTVDQSALGLSIAGNPSGLVAATGSGNLQAAFPDASVAQVSPVAGISPVTFTVSAVALGAATLTITDDSGATATVAVTVGP